MVSLVKVAGVQMDVRIADKDHNLHAMANFLREARQQNAHLTVFPECAVTGYCFTSLEEAAEVAEPIPGPATEFMTTVCQEYGGFAVFGMLEADGDRVFNAAVLVGAEGVLGSYRKVHLPFLGVDMFTTPGDRDFAVQQAGDLRVGMNICYDAAFPEAARVLALEGADLIVLPTNWPPGAQCTAECIINARALENHVYYIAVNRIGRERGFEFIGNSKICDPTGRLLAQASHTNETILYAEIDPALARDKHVVRVPGKHEIDRFADRHPERYGEIVQPKDA